MAAVKRKSCHRCGSEDVPYRKQYCDPCKAVVSAERKARDDLKYRTAHRAEARARAREWLKKNKERNRVACKARRDADLEAARQKDRERRATEVDRRRAMAAEYYWKNRQRVLERTRSPDARAKARDAAARRRQTNPYLRAYMSISRQIRQALTARKAGRRWEQIVGYSLDDLTRHIERQFRRGMTWANYGQWHIDHIRPRSLFDFSQGDDVVRECWSLQNLQPLWAGENLSKSGKRTHLI